VATLERRIEAQEEWRPMEARAPTARGGVGRATAAGETGQSRGSWESCGTGGGL